jgi:hypothetical protein
MLQEKLDIIDIINSASCILNFINVLTYFQTLSKQRNFTRVQRAQKMQN